MFPFELYHFDYICTVFADMIRCQYLGKSQVPGIRIQNQMWQSYAKPFASSKLVFIHISTSNRFANWHWGLEDIKWNTLKLQYSFDCYYLLSTLQLLCTNLYGIIQLAQFFPVVFPNSCDLSEFSCIWCLRISFICTSRNYIWQPCRRRANVILASFRTNHCHCARILKYVIKIQDNDTAELENVVRFYSLEIEKGSKVHLKSTWKWEIIIEKPIPIFANCIRSKNQFSNVDFMHSNEWGLGFCLCLVKCSLGLVSFPFLSLRVDLKPFFHLQNKSGARRRHRYCHK